jgi:hypothetical protein
VLGIVALGENQALNQQSGLMAFSKLRPAVPGEAGERWTTTIHTKFLPARRGRWSASPFFFVRFFRSALCGAYRRFDTIVAGIFEPFCARDRDFATHFRRRSRITDGRSDPAESAPDWHFARKFCNSCKIRQNTWQLRPPISVELGMPIP